MTRQGEFIGFAGIAVLAHLWMFAQFAPIGSQSQGAGGQASVSLMASTAEMAEMLAAWTRPVQVMAQVPTAMETPLADGPSVPLASRPEGQINLPTMPKLATALPGGLPQLDTQTAAPAELRQAPKASARPKTPTPQQVAQPTAAKKPKPKIAQPAAKPQKAQGGQSGVNAGNTQRTQSATLSKAARQSLIAKWGASIRNRVERRKRYPSGTKASGTTILRISITPAGRLTGIAVVKSSGTKKLDQAAINAVKRARYAAAPKGLNAAQYKFNLPVAFKRN